MECNNASSRNDIPWYTNFVTSKKEYIMIRFFIIYYNFKHLWNSFVESIICKKPFEALLNQSES